MTPENPLIPEGAPVARLLEATLAGLECGADDDELTEALRLLGQPIVAPPPSRAAIERLFCECWNALCALGLRREWIEPEPDPEPASEPESAPVPGDLRPERRLQPGDLVPEGELEPVAMAGCP